MKDIKGVLSIANKIWFNDINRCRLRICGFNNKQIKQLENSGLTDITITKISEDKEHENNRVYKIEAVMSIEDGSNIDEWFEEICGVCEKEKLVHVDMRTSLNDPCFICEDCENDRNRSEDMLERVMFGDEDE